MIKHTSLIAVHLTHTGTIASELFHGMLEFARQQHEPWQIRSEEAAEFRTTLSQRTVDGVITAVWEDDQQKDWVRRIVRSRLPAVNVLTDMGAKVPSVASDEREFGRRGAEYFMGRGLQHFAYFGVSAVWSRTREESFAAALQAAGRSYIPTPTDAAPPMTSTRNPQRMAQIRRWVQSLPRPIGVLTCNDLASKSLLAACQLAGRHVPDDVQILGIDNDALICELSPVPLSSIGQDFRRLGFITAKTLAQRMKGQPVSRRTTLVPPGPVVTRRSTDRFAFDDVNIAECLRLIDEYAGRGLSVKQILERVPVSRTWLDREFKRLVGHTPSEEIRRRRLERVQQLLVTTGLPLHEIAQRCGFSRVENLSRFFNDRYGTSPRQFRRQLS